MVLTGCEEQVLATAARLNGDPTADELAGELTVMPSLDTAVEGDWGEPVDGVEVDGVEVDGVEVDGAEVDGEPVAACVAMVPFPPHPAATKASGKESARALV
jgi:hypothetical protein